MELFIHSVNISALKIERDILISQTNCLRKKLNLLAQQGKEKSPAYIHSQKSYWDKLDKIDQYENDLFRMEE